MKISTLRLIALILCVGFLTLTLDACDGGSNGVDMDEYDRIVRENKDMREQLSESTGSTASTRSVLNNAPVNNNRPPRDLEETPASDFEYKAIAGGVEITKYTGTSIRVRIPEKIEGVPVTSLGDNSFQKSGIMEVYIPDRVTNIGVSAFEGNTGLTTVVIPNGVNSIGERAFFNCEGLTNMVIPDSVTNVGDSVFSGCTGLKSVAIGNGVTRIGNIDDEGLIGGFGSFEEWTVRNLGFFNGCKELTHVSIGNNVTEIGKWAFAGCSSLSSIIIPDSTMRIGDGAFVDCKGLTNIIISDNVNYIVGKGRVEEYIAADRNQAEYEAEYEVYRSNYLLGITDVTPPMPPTTLHGGFWDTFRGCTNLVSATYRGKTYNAVSYKNVTDLPKEFYDAVNGTE